MSNQTKEKSALQLRFIDGTSITANLPSDCKLVNVAKFVCKYAKEKALDKKKEGNYYHEEKGIYFAIPFPKTEYKPGEEDFENKTIKELGFYPKASLLIRPNIENLELKKSDQSFEAKIDPNSMPGTRLHGDNTEAKEKFKKKMKEQEMEEQKKELEEKKKLLAKVRGRIEINKGERKEIYGNVKEKEENNDISDNQ